MAIYREKSRKNQTIHIQNSQFVIYFSLICQRKCGKYGSNCRRLNELFLTKLVGESVACGGRNRPWSMVIHGVKRLVYEHREVEWHSFENLINSGNLGTSPSFFQLFNFWKKKLKKFDMSLNHQIHHWVKF